MSLLKRIREKRPTRTKRLPQTISVPSLRGNTEFDGIDSAHLKRLLFTAVRIEASNIEQIGSELAIQWNDESETFLPLRFLRTACPCAACGGEPDVMGDVVRPSVSYTDRSFELRGWKLVGGYALQPDWADGHNTGLYTYQYLRRIDPARAP